MLRQTLTRNCRFQSVNQLLQQRIPIIRKNKVWHGDYLKTDNDCPPAKNSRPLDDLTPHRHWFTNRMCGRQCVRNMVD